ncbi:MAG: nucleotidyltransferase family protein [Lachnospiraceae bacterium]|nr:nucleotidyltransferase family protein [Lachnospiraceae bacterium]
MKITGIICEYNPFHNGHVYQIGQCKNDKDDFCIAVMSGDWIQRGGPAIIDKYERAKMALKGGVDLVIELPTAYATGSASDFAFGGISLLDSLGCVDELCFGAESPRDDSFDKVVDFMNEFGEMLAVETAEYMREGNSYPKARELALSNHFNKHIVQGLCKPNNILALEYNLAIRKLKSNIVPKAILRKGSEYADSELNMVSYSSATAIRNSIMSGYEFMIKNDNGYRNDDMFVGASTYMAITGETLRSAMSEPLSPIKNHVPATTYEILLNALGKSYPLVYSNFSRELGYKLILEVGKGFEDYLDVTRELSDKICKNISYFKTVDQFCDLLKTKEITYARISRCMTHILLDIKKDTFPEGKRAGYARILGFRKDSEKLLKIIKDHSSIPIISKLADAPRMLDDKDLKMLGKDIQAAHMYDFVSACKYQKDLKNEFTQAMIIV